MRLCKGQFESAKKLLNRLCDHVLTPTFWPLASLTTTILSLVRTGRIRYSNSISAPDIECNARERSLGSVIGENMSTSSTSESTFLIFQNSQDTSRGHCCRMTRHSAIESSEST